MRAKTELDRRDTSRSVAKAVEELQCEPQGMGSEWPVNRVAFAIIRRDRASWLVWLQLPVAYLQLAGGNSGDFQPEEKES